MQQVGAGLYILEYSKALNFIALEEIPDYNTKRPDLITMYKIYQ